MKLDIFYGSEVKSSENFAVVGGEHKDSKVDIVKRSEKLPLLFARLAYVFSIYDENLKDDFDFEDFVEITLKSLRVKPALKDHNTTLEEVSGLLYLIDEASEVEIFVGEDVGEDEYLNLLRFANMFNKVKITPNRDVDFYWVD